MSADGRRGQLVELIRIKGFATLPDLSKQLGVSESTIRRDLNALERDGTARRTHGGVVYTGPSPKFPHFEGWQRKNWARKRAIATAASATIERGETVLLDGGSTTYELAQQLRGQGLQVVTNSLPVANLFASDETTELVFVGGVIQSRTGVALGPYATSMLQSLRCRRAFISTAGVNESGLFNSNMLLVETERAMLECADTTILVADSSKFGRTSLCKVCDLDELDQAIVDPGMPSKWRDILRGAGVELILAEETAQV